MRNAVPPYFKFSFSVTYEKININKDNIKFIISNDVTFNFLNKFKFYYSFLFLKFILIKRVYNKIYKYAILKIKYKVKEGAS